MDEGWFWFFGGLCYCIDVTCNVYTQQKQDYQKKPLKTVLSQDSRP